MRMTIERKDEIWAMLPDDFKKLAQLYYNEASDICATSHTRDACYYYCGVIDVLKALFDQHNLSKNNGFKQCS